jgi:hypothetical protein
VDITIYLPDELGQRAKAAGLNLSRLLRSAVTDEFERREQMAKTLSEPETYELGIEDPDGRGYIGRITGKMIAADDSLNGATAFLTEDQRVIVYHRQRYVELDDPVEELRDWFEDEPAEYAAALEALGEKPVIDL